MLVRVMFQIIEACMFVLLLPVRAVSVFAGRGIVWMLRLPFRILGLLAQLIGLLVVLALVVLAVVTVFSLFSVA